MVRGEPVEVRQVWASSAYPPWLHRAWFKGYVFEGEDGPNVIVRHTGGTFRNLCVRFPRADVRAQT